MARQEYKGPVLDELRGKTHFVCECCSRRMPISVLDIHHKNPQLGYEDHSRQNLALLDSGCHDIIHTIANSLAALKKTAKRPAVEMAREYAESLHDAQDQVNATVTRLIELAVLVAQAILLKKDGQLEGGNVDTVVSLPPSFNSKFKILAKTIKSAKGRPLGKEKLVLMAVLNLIASKFPETKSEVDAYVMSEILGAEPPTVKTQPTMNAQRF